MTYVWRRGKRCKPYGSVRFYAVRMLSPFLWNVSPVGVPMQLNDSFNILMVDLALTDSSHPVIVVQRGSINQNASTLLSCGK